LALGDETWRDEGFSPNSSGPRELRRENGSVLSEMPPGGMRLQPMMLKWLVALPSGPQSDWNAVWSRIEALLHARKSRWKATEQKLFRSVFTQKDPEAEPIASGSRDDGYEPDADLRDFENVPLKDDIDAYFEREVHPHVPDAWMDRTKDKVGYEINFNRHFYKYTPPRPLSAIDAELKEAEGEIMRLLREVTE